MDRQKKLFWVRSLDDMKEVSTSYHFEVTENSETVRKSMWVPSKEQVAEYLDKRSEAITAGISERERELAKAKKNLETFQNFRTEFKI